MSKDIRRRMSDLHEAYISKLFGGYRHPGSGNQARNQGDGRRSAHQHQIGFVWDCKATLGKSISVSVDQIAKITEQAGLDKPLIPLRIYENDRLTHCVDLVAMSPDDLVEILELLETYQKRMTQIGQRITSMVLSGWAGHPILDSLSPLVEL